MTRWEGWEVTEEKRRGLDLVIIMDIVKLFKRILNKKAKKRREGPL